MELCHDALFAESELLCKPEVRFMRLASGAGTWHQANMRLKLKELRKAKGKGWTGEHLAGLIGVSKSYISELENGIKQPSGSLMVRMADALGCQVGDLYEGQEDEIAEIELKAHLAIMMDLPEKYRQAIQLSARGIRDEYLRSIEKSSADIQASETE